MTPRAYQVTAREAIAAGWDQFSKQLLVFPTGAGKTLLFSWVAKDFLPQRTLILAHREELVDQAIVKLHAATGIFAGKEKAEFHATLRDDVVVASVQSMIRRRDKWPADHFGLVVADEAHHAIGPSWQSVLSHFSGAKVLGVTATPDRGDRKNLGQFFENVAAEVTLFDLIHQGFLSKIAVKSIPLQIDLRSVRQSMGDFNESDLGNALAPYLDEIARQIKAEAGFRRTLVFVPLVATSKKFVETCQSHGINAEHVDGNSEDRAEILARFAAGEIDLLSNAMLLTEGYDDPGIDCVVILRPTRSRSLYAQMVGRGTRIADGKRNLLLLDFLWLHEKHDLIRPAHLVASSHEEAEQIMELAQAGGPDQQELDLEVLSTEAQEQREAKLKEELAEKAKRKTRFIDPVEFAIQLANYEPAMAWELREITATQRATLERNGFNPDAIKMGLATEIIKGIDRRREQQLATPKQVKFLRRFRHPNPERATFEEAGAFLDRKFNRRREMAA